MTLIDEEFAKVHDFEKLLNLLKKINENKILFSKDEKQQMVQIFKDRLKNNKNVSADNPCLIKLENNNLGYLPEKYVSKIILIYKEKHNRYKKRDEEVNNYFERWR